MQEKNIQKAFKIKKVLNEYFRLNTSISKIEAKALMPLFIQKNIFEKNHQDGYEIRELLRQLRKDNLLKLIPHVLAEDKDQNTNWFFIRI